MLATELKQQFCMPVASPAYPPPPFYYEGARWLYIYFQTAPEVIQALVPEPLVPDAAPMVVLYVARLPIVRPLATLYHEAGLAIPVRYGRQAGLYFSHMYLDSAIPIVGGREIWGSPKKEAAIAFDEEGQSVRALVTHLGSALIQATAQIEPTPATSAPAEPEVAFTVKLVPSVQRGAPPEVLQLVAVPFKQQIRERHAGSARLELLPSPLDTLGNVPVLGVAGAELRVTDFALDWGEVVVDYLARPVAEQASLAYAT